MYAYVWTNGARPRRNQDSEGHPYFSICDGLLCPGVYVRTESRLDEVKRREAEGTGDRDGDARDSRGSGFKESRARERETEEADTVLIR